MEGSVKKTTSQSDFKCWRLVVLEFGGDGEHRAVLILPIGVSKVISCHIATPLPLDGFHGKSENRKRMITRGSSILGNLKWNLQMWLLSSLILELCCKDQQIDDYKTEINIQNQFYGNPSHHPKRQQNETKELPVLFRVEAIAQRIQITKVDYRLYQDQSNKFNSLSFFMFFQGLKKNIH